MITKEDKGTWWYKNNPVSHSTPIAVRVDNGTAVSTTNTLSI